MGRPPLPAPTDISSSAIGTSDDLATDISRVTDRTSYSIPEDGSPVTITTKKIRGGKAESQTSLLIEYFEGSKSGDGIQPRPSVRVRVTPSGSKHKRREGDHIQITETGKNRKPSYTRRISLPQAYDDPLVPSEISDTSSGRPPVEVEVLQGTSDFSQRRDQSPSRYIVAPSDISSMPPDSILDGSTPAIIIPRPRSTSLDRNRTIERTVDMDGLKAPARTRSRSLSKERLALSAAKKIHERSATTREPTGKQKTSSRRSSGSSTREYVLDESASPKSRSRGYREESRLVVEPSEMSVLSDQSAGRYSVRSGASTSSINNPKLLSAVEDAIKRLILPELNAVKEEQARQKNRIKFEDTTRDSMAPAGSRENLRRVSKSSSSPNVSGKPGVVVDDVDTIKTRKSRRSSRGSEKSHETAIHEESSRRKSSGERKHSAGKIAAAALVGAGLTAAALKHHDSIQDLNEDRERRKKRSKSRSRSASISESIGDSGQITRRDAAHELGIPPMPMQQSSAVGTDLTRDSILSAETNQLTSPSESESIHKTKIREVLEVSRGSPRQVVSHAPQTPTRTPTDIRTRSPLSVKSDKSGSGKTAAAALAAAAGVAGGVLLKHEHDQHDQEYSPMASPGYRDNIVEHERVRSLKSGESLSSARKARRQKSKLSVDEISTTDHLNSKQRPHGVSLEPAYDILPEEPYSPEATSAGATEQWLAREHETNERLRREYEEESQVDSERRHTMYTDDSYMDDYGDKSFDAGRDIRDVGANPEYVHTPVAVESAVASLHEPSVLSVQSSLKTDSVHGEYGNEYGLGGMARSGKGSFDSQNPGNSKERWEAIRDQAIANARQQTSTASPRQSDASFDGRPVMGASAIPLADDAEPAIGHGFDDASDVTTNPSIIKGPIGGLEHGDRSHWPYDPTPAMPNRDSSVHEDHIARDATLGLGAGATGLGLGLAAARSRESSKHSLDNAREASYENVRAEPWQDNHSGDQIPGLDGAQRFAGGYTSPAGKAIDEGYQSGAIQGGDVTPDLYVQNRGFDNASLDHYDDGEDPFTTQKHLRHTSGLSHGMESPLYDAALGKGIDRIKDRDVVALMDHLTVRDAHRNARDTEILTTLVRNAADMRNQWEDMKKLMQEHDKMVMAHTDRAADKTVQRMLGGPRPLPASQAKVPRRVGSEETDESSKARKNVFRRAFRSLSSKNTQDLSKIEGMLMQLLDEVEDLKHTQTIGGGQPQDNTRSNSVGSYENRANTDPGYEPEGQAGTSSSPAQSGHLSNPSSKHIGTMHSGYDIHRTSDGNRISTVLEGDEEDEEWTPQSAPPNSSQRYSDGDRMLTPTQEVRRGQSVPLDTPPDQRVPLQNSRSAEETPKTDKSRKHKSGASSIFSAIPKISRWSKTTSSTVPDDSTIRNSAQKNRPYSQHSRSGSNLHLHEYDDYDLQDDDRIRSRTSFENQARSGAAAQPRSPSPLIPEQRKSMEDPKYQAHRNSLNLEHPQPRPGPTHRHQTYLETQALGYENPPTPDAADQWGTTPALALNRNMNVNRFSGSSGQAPTHGELSPVHSEDGDEDAYSDHSASEQAHNRLPPRIPPKEPLGADDGPLVPPKIPVGFGYQSPYSNSGMHIASPLEPIEEVRYSLETDRSSARDMTPSPRPTAMMASVARKITGPRDMPPSARRVDSGGSAKLAVPVRKPVPAEQYSREKSPVPSLESYRSSLDSETF